mmetsp:Transcript_5841/g.12188  ORF Transcript_5841/g.12188 Transcript_5841/m.12188 type:complete len:103 (-) Transcript_5841:21-329(-)
MWLFQCCSRFFRPTSLLLAMLGLLLGHLPFVRGLNSSSSSYAMEGETDSVLPAVARQHPGPETQAGKENMLDLSTEDGANAFPCSRDASSSSSALRLILFSN